jgi:hypothetical protein
VALCKGTSTLRNAMQRLALIAWASITCLMSQARATPLDSQGIATDLFFIEIQVTKTLTSLGSYVQISRLGRRQRNVEDDESFGRSSRMDKRVFPGPALAPVSGDGVAAVARGGAAMDGALGLAGLGAPD